MAGLDRRVLIGGGLVLPLAGSCLLAAGPALALTAAGAADMQIGAARARVTMITYVSAACPHCAHWFAEVYPVLKARYVDTGKLRLVLREMVTDPMVLAVGGALLARCIGSGQRYMDAMSAIFAEQERIYQEGDLKPGMLRVGAKFGMTEDQVMACITDTAGFDALKARLELASADGINTTPAIFVNGEKVADPNLTPVTKAIDTALRRRR